MAGARQPTRPVEWIGAIAGGLALSALLVWLLRGGTDTPAAPPTPATVPANAPYAPPDSGQAPPVAALPAGGPGDEPAAISFPPPAAAGETSVAGSISLPSPTGAAAPPPAAASPLAPGPATASANGLTLRGLFARGPDQAGSAIVEGSDGRQRLVRIGREAAPGIRLVSVEPGAAVFDSGGQLFRLSFGEARPGAAPTAAAPQPNQRQRAIQRWQLALEPNREKGRIRGFVVRPGKLPPLLAKAGLRAGDILLSVNKGAIDSEGRIEDLEEEVSTSYTAEFIYERDGVRKISTLEVSKHP